MGLYSHKPHIFAVGATQHAYSQIVQSSTWACTENIWLFLFYLKGESCVSILAWGTAQLLNRTSISGFFTVLALSARRKLKFFPKRVTTGFAGASHQSECLRLHHKCGYLCKQPLAINKTAPSPLPSVLSCSSCSEGWQKSHRTWQSKSYMYICLCMYAGICILNMHVY